MGNAVYRAYEALAGKAGLTFDSGNGVIYGRRNGFDVIIYAADSRYPYLITVSLGATRAGGCLGKDDWKRFIKEHKPVQNVKNDGNVVEMVLRATSNTEKFCENFILAFDALSSFLIANGYTKCCHFCGQQVETHPYYVSNTFVHLCQDCSARVSSELHLANHEKKQKKENVIAGIVGALIGSLIGVLCIVAIGQLGYVAALSGIIMAICTLKGYEFLGGKLSTKGIVASIVLMLVMTYVGNQLEWAIVVTRELGYDFLYSFQLVPVLLHQEAIASSAYWGGLALVYIFVALGAVPTILNVIKSQKNQGKMFRIGMM